MKVVIQRVSNASVSVNNKLEGAIGRGLLLFLAVTDGDSADDVSWLAEKIVNLRIFSDAEGKMNLSLVQTAGELLVVSQFTLYAQTKKGNRPSFTGSAKPETAVPLYEAFIKNLRTIQPGKVACGIFGATMQVQLTNDGPVTIIIDTKIKE